MKELKQDLWLSALQLSFFVIFALVIAFCAGCSRIKIPGADNITSIKVEVCYEENFCVEGEGKTLDEVADSLELEYKQAEEAIKEVKEIDAQGNGT